MTNFFKKLIAGEEGATMVEYALMVALIGAALITVVMDWRRRLTSPPDSR